MTSCPDPDSLLSAQQVLGGDLHRTLVHISACTECTQTLTHLRAVEQGFASEAPAQEFVDRVMRQVEVVMREEASLTVSTPFTWHLGELWVFLCSGLATLLLLVAATPGALSVWTWALAAVAGMLATAAFARMGAAQHWPSDRAA